MVTTLKNLYAHQGRPVDAEKMFHRAQAGKEKASASQPKSLEWQERYIRLINIQVSGTVAQVSSRSHQSATSADLIPEEATGSSQSSVSYLTKVPEKLQLN